MTRPAAQIGQKSKAKVIAKACGATGVALAIDEDEDSTIITGRIWKINCWPSVSRKLELPRRAKTAFTI